MINLQKLFAAGPISIFLYFSATEFNSGFSFALIFTYTSVCDLFMTLYELIHSKMNTVANNCNYLKTLGALRNTFPQLSHIALVSQT